MTEQVRFPASPLQEPATTAVSRNEMIVLGVIIALTVLVYAQTSQFRFCNFDDDVHVYENRHVNTGLSWNNLRWAFEIHGPSQWHPLAWISHQVDSQIFGARTTGGDAGGHHAVNALLHLANVILVYAMMRRLLGRPWPALVSAAIFAIHPLNVESVAWVSERRNTLCLFFVLLTFLAYARFVQKGGLWNYALVCGLHAAALMSKSMAVTVPCVLLLLDIGLWRRLEKEGTGMDRPQTSLRRLPGLVYEKLPLLLLSAISCVLTVWCQQAAGVVSSLKSIPFDLRVANALAAYAAYLQTFLWPVRLSVFYPHPAMMSDHPWDTLRGPAVVGVVLLISITAVAMVCWKRFPTLILGWFWFLGTLVPMIGLVQVGLQQRADRYLYLPMLGLLFGLTGCFSRNPGQSVRSRRGLSAVVSFIVVLLAIRAFDQTTTWKDSLTLFEQALSVEPRNHWAYLNAGLALQERGQWDQAAQHFAAALAIKPDYALAHYNLGVLLFERGDVSGAADRFQDAVRLEPNLADAWVRLGAVYGSRGRFELAEQAFRTASTLERDHVDAWFNLGLILEQRQKFSEARDAYETVLTIDPEFEPAKKRINALALPPGQPLR